ncbi:Ribosomal RNA large subunit methyltransferase H [Bienertia sinuspersici]
MCPLRIILIFLSATIAGLLVLKNFKSVGDVEINSVPDSPKPKDSSPSSCKDKIMSVVGSGFWTVVDMASGRYLWRFFASGTNKSS